MTTTSRKTAAAWKPGQSGNPKGKPKGARSKATVLAQALMEGEIDGIVRSVIDAAKGGDISAARLILDKVVPSLKPRDMPVELGGLEGPLSEQGRTVLHAMADGRISPDQGQALMSVITGQIKLMEYDDLIKRIEALEANENRR